VEAAATPAAPAESADDLALGSDDLASSEPVAVAAAPEADVPEADVSESVTSESVTSEAVASEAVAVQAAAAPEAVVESGEDDAAAEPAPIVTETMAEVLLRQGYTADALLIYRELQRRSGGDPRLADKIAALEAQTAPVAARPPAYTARETGGQSVHDFFRALLAARITGPVAPASSPAATPAATAAPARSTRPATDGLSLSAVFGEEASPVPPAVPAGSAAEPSFDAFFGTAGGTAGTGRAARAPEAKDDDLDQFHAWLQNLKR
jgi:hypothetical protein